MGRRATVIVADDDELLQALLEHKLASAGYAVVCLDHGQEVLEHAERLAPDLIVLDAMMPVMDGFETLRRLKADAVLSAIPVIMLTAMRREADIVTALRLGAADYLSKPFNPDELIARLSRFAPSDRHVA